MKKRNSTKRSQNNAWLRKRNIDICYQWLSGKSPREMEQEFDLTAETIRRIIRSFDEIPLRIPGPDIGTKYKSRKE